MKRYLPPFVQGIACAALLCGHAFAAAYVGTNQPGRNSAFTFVVVPGTTNLSLMVSNSATAYSHLFLKKGGAASVTNFDFTARLNGVTNQINLQTPDLTVTNYGLCVFTPQASALHVFKVKLQTNVTNLRSAARPELKPAGFVTTGWLTNLSTGNWHYFQVDVPTNQPGWRLALTSSAQSDANLYVRRDAVPTTSRSDKSSTAKPIDTLIFPNAELTNATYFIGVYLPGTATNPTSYKLTLEIPGVRDLVWDPGLTHEGTQVFTNTSKSGGDYFFRILPQNTSVGAWRTALNVQSGQVNLYLRQGAFSDNPASYTFARSERVGSNGFVLHAGQFGAGQTWHLCVSATKNAKWNLVSGEAFVTDLGVLPAAGSANTTTNVVMGAEGMRFFRTTPPVGTLAWRLWLNGATNEILVKKTGAPHPATATASDLKQARQMLVVPNYLVAGDQYFVGVADSPGALIFLDSRQQRIIDAPFLCASNLVVTGCTYVTYRLNVPVQQIAWLSSIAPTLGDANLCVRRDYVPNEWNNEGYSEVPGLATDSISLVPPPPASPAGTPGLSDGIFFVTLYGPSNYNARFSSGTPAITDVPYVSTTTNNDPWRAGWRYFRVLDITNQLGTLGWDLFLQNQPPGTELALRRNAVPGRWNSRQNNKTNIVSAGWVDFSGPDGFLQRPGHQADIWYIGAYNPTNVLGPFVLNLRTLTGPPIGFDGALARTNVVNQASGKFYFWRVDVPPNAVGWDLRLSDVTSGDPRLVIRREALPTALTNSPWAKPNAATNWPSGSQWAPDEDWTQLPLSASGVSEVGRVFACGMGNPLSQGSYYVGVLNAVGAAPANYTLVSRGIGPGFTIPVNLLSFDGGVAVVNDLPPREAAYFRVTVPDAESWKLRLATNVGESLLILQRGSLPNIAAASGYWPAILSGGRQVQKPGNEEYVFFPTNGYPPIESGTYYLAVVSEGHNPVPSQDCIGTGSIQATLTSFGPLISTNMGLLNVPELTATGSLAAGEVQTYDVFFPSDVHAIEIWLEHQTGNPLMTLEFDGWVAKAQETYGNNGGVQVKEHSDFLFNVADISYSSCRITVVAAREGTMFTNATYQLRVNPVPGIPLAFDGGIYRMDSGHKQGTWRYFPITVPPDALGWDIRLTGVTSGDPRLLVGRLYWPMVFKTEPWDYPEQWSRWLVGFKWAPTLDWTDFTQDADGETGTGRILQMGMGNPLEPGDYVVAVSGGSAYTGGEFNYTLVSRGIGPGYSIPVTPLAFVNGIASISDLRPRDVAYYSVQVPTNAPLWKVRLGADSGDSLLLVQKDALPCIKAGKDAAYELMGGRKLTKAGHEHYLMLPMKDAVDVVAGSYYLSVVSLGVNPSGSRTGSNSVNATLRSFGALLPANLGTVWPGTDIVRPDTLEGGATALYEFTVPPETLSLEISLEDRIARPRMTYHGDSQIAKPAGTYGNDGGQQALWAHDTQILVANPTNGLHRLTVFADQGGSSSGPLAVYTNASYRLRIHAVGAQPIPFDGVRLVITDHEPNSWRYFIVTNVPPNAVGWDVRITNVLSGDPRLVIRRGILPDNLKTHGHPTGGWTPGTATNWPLGYQWGAGLDWTGYANDGDGTNRNGHILQMGKGNPLTPGSNYYIGVLNGTATGTGTNLMSYTLVTRGIGAGFTIPVTPLGFAGGSATNAGLPVRETACYSIDVPSNTPNWKVRLAAGVGDTLLLVQKDFLPSVAGDSTAATQPGGGYELQKAGNEHYVLLPNTGQTNIPAGRYYLLATSEGLFPGSNDVTRIGTNWSSHLIQSQGSLPIEDLGQVAAEGFSRTNSLEGGELRAYRLSTTSNLLALEVRLDNRVGNPCLSLRTGSGIPQPFNKNYGVNWGDTPQWTKDRLITVANPVATNYTLVVQANFATNTFYPDADYVLRVGPAPIMDLALDPSMQGCSAGSPPICTNASACGLLGDNERAFYRVEVPAALPDGSPFLGWMLTVSNEFGNANVRVRKSLLSTDTGTSQTPFVADMAVIVPPFLTPGTWYIEVKGVGSSSYCLYTSAVQLQRPAWTMPAPGQPIITPGLTNGPLFGDTGVQTNGLPLPSAEGGIDLEQGHMHYYAITVPSDNGGLLRTVLEAISGNPNLYIRSRALPTLTHRDTGASGTIYDRALAGSTTEYGNWVPGDGRYEGGLSNGVWYVAVRAGGISNCRYRLRLSTGSVTNLPLNSSVTNQTLAGGDWRYYRFTLPTNASTSWSFSFQQQVGDVVVYVRDRIPPGQNATATDYRHWATDDKNHSTYPTYDAPATYTNTLPPLRPGHMYYLGFRATNDATFSLISTASGPPLEVLPSIAFYGGIVTENLAPGAVLRYRIDVPDDAARWVSTSVHSTSVKWYLEQGSPPTLTADDHRTSGTSANVNLNQYLRSATGWPWVAGQMYFLVVTNTSASSQTFSWNMDGRNCSNDDNDNDGLLDCWESTHFGNTTSNSGINDPDKDGNNNLTEFQDGTNPNDPTSMLARLTVNAVGPGSVTVLPGSGPFAYGTAITLSAAAHPGYAFIGWSGTGASGSATPLALSMTTNRTVTAWFGTNYGACGSLVADYQFDGNLASSVGAPPPLTYFNGGQVFTNQVVGTGMRRTLRFPQGSGLILSNASTVVASNAYTVVILLKLDNVTGLRRVFDAKNASIDQGLYVRDGRLVLYPASGESVVCVMSNVWHQVVLTRDLNGQAAIYCDGVPRHSVNDTSSYAVVSSANTWRFFKDNTPLTQETGGSMARIRLFQCALSPDDVAGLDLVPGGSATNIVSLSEWSVDPAGRFYFKIAGPSVPLLRVQGSDDLIQWSTLTDIQNFPGLIWFTNPAALPSSQRVFRVIVP